MPGGGTLPQKWALALPHTPRPRSHQSSKSNPTEEPLPRVWSPVPTATLWLPRAQLSLPPPRPRCTQLLWVRPTCCRHIGLGWGGGSSRLRPQAQAPATPTSSQGGSDKGGGKDPQQARRGCRLPRRPSEAPRPGALVTPLPRAGQRRPARCLVKRETLGGTLGPLPPSPTWSPPRVAPGAGLCWVQESRERPRRGRGREVSPTWVSGWTWKGRTGHWGGEPATRPRGARPCAGPRQRGGGTRRCRRRAC